MNIRVVFFLIFSSSLLGNEATSQVSGWKEFTKLDNVTQDSFKLMVEGLQSISYRMVMDTIVEIRKESGESFSNEFPKFLKTKNSFSVPLDSLRQVSTQYPEDSTFRLITWQYPSGNDEYLYFGYLQKSNGDFYKLIDGGRDLGNISQSVLKTTDWPGGIVYKIKSFKSEGKKKYLLLSFRMWNSGEKRKMADVLVLKDNSTFEFGSPVFYRKEKGKKEFFNRIILDYSGTAHLNFSGKKNMLLHDNLIFIGGLPLPVPDGSFVGYKYKKGFWEYVDKPEKEVAQKEAIRPAPILNGRNGKDLIGN
jgi:hypothetical protein